MRGNIQGKVKILYTTESECCILFTPLRIITRTFPKNVNNHDYHSTRNSTTFTGIIRHLPLGIFIYKISQCGSNDQCNEYRNLCHAILFKSPSLSSRVKSLKGRWQHRYPRPYGRGTFKIQAALVRCPAPLVHGCTAG